jgi:hypothetical protein
LRGRRFHKKKEPGHLSNPSKTPAGWRPLTRISAGKQALGLPFLLPTWN